MPSNAGAGAAEPLHNGVAEAPATASVAGAATATEGTADRPIDLVAASQALETAGAAVEAAAPGEPEKKKAKKVTLRLSNGFMFTRVENRVGVYWFNSRHEFALLKFSFSYVFLPLDSKR